LKRLLAFLTTDYVLTERVHRTWHRGQLVALGSLAMLIVAYLAWCNSTHWPLFLLMWIGVALAVRYCPDPPVRGPDMEQLWQFSPFLSEDDWQGHARLLDQYRIPPYDPQKHMEPYPPRLGWWVMDIQIWIWRFVGLPLVILPRLWPHTESVLLREANQGQAVAVVTV